MRVKITKETAAPPLPKPLSEMTIEEQRRYNQTFNARLCTMAKRGIITKEERTVIYSQYRIALPSGSYKGFCDGIEMPAKNRRITKETVIPPKPKDGMTTIERKEYNRSIRRRLQVLVDRAEITEEERTEIYEKHKIPVPEHKLNRSIVKTAQVEKRDTAGLLFHQLTEEEVRAHNKQNCMKCTHYLGPTGAKGRSAMSCSGICNYPFDMEAKTGIFQLRHCSPLECREKGFFQEAAKKVSRSGRNKALTLKGTKYV